MSTASTPTEKEKDLEDESYNSKESGDKNIQAGDKVIVDSDGKVTKVVNGNGKPQGSTELPEGSTEVTVDYSSEKWNQDYTWKNNGVTFNIQRTGFDGNESKTATITTDKNVEVKYIAVKAASGYVLYEVPGGVLYAGVAYTVKTPDLGDGKEHAISHICLAGVGNEVLSETETLKLSGNATKSETMTAGSGLTLSFKTGETTTKTDEITEITRDWIRNWTNTTVNEGETPENPPVNPPVTPPKNPDPNSNLNIPDGEPPLTDISDGESPLTDIPDGESPLTDIPDMATPAKTGDLSALFLALSALSGAGLAGVSFIDRKKRDEE